MEIERLRRQRWPGKQIASETGVSPATSQQPQLSRSEPDGQPTERLRRGDVHLR